MEKRRKETRCGKRCVKYAVCLLTGLALYLAAEAVSGAGRELEDRTLSKKEWGQGEARYSLWVEGEGTEGFRMEVAVPEKKMSGVQGEELLEDMLTLLCDRIRGNNESLMEVREDLELTEELPEYGVTVSWNSEKPEFISSTGIILAEELPEEGMEVRLEARLSNGIFTRSVWIPIWLYPREEGAEEELERVIREDTEKDPGSDTVTLPERLRGKTVTYRVLPATDNKILLVLGGAAAVCLFLKEKQDREKRRKRREAGLLLDYSEIISRFLILTGAGFTIRQAWMRMVPKQRPAGWLTCHPAYEEIRTTLNQMETGVSEMQAYGDFGRRCGLRCYARFASLLQNGLQTGNRNLRRLLEAEMEEAFQQRKDTAKRLGEEASGKLLLPLFLMLGVVMVMITAPAFLTLV